MPKRVLRGVVTSDKQDKTVTVMVERRVRHPLYKKFVKKSRKIAAHDPENRCREGVQVSIQECPPVSKTKRFTVVYAYAADDPRP